MINPKKLQKQRKSQPPANRKNSLVLTRKELEVIDKKLKNKKMNQQDSNYLSKYVRPKLKEIAEINAKNLLTKLKYNQKARPIENKIKKLILKYLKEVQAIILYGSAIQNNYKNYNDIDVLIVTKKEVYKKISEKAKLIKSLKEKAEKENLNLDIQLLSKKTLKQTYPHSPSLIYQLKDKKIIYGKLNLPKKVELYNINLKMKMDWTEIEDTPSGLELYKSIRNVILVRLLIKGIVDNSRLNTEIDEEIGKTLAQKLKNSTESKEDRKIANYHLQRLIKDVEHKLKGALWERKLSLKV